MLCHVTRCNGSCHFVGTFECPFCSDHYNRLTPFKRGLVLSIQHFSVLDIESRPRAVSIINQCRAYLATKEERRSA